jgi:Na+/H+ antiporter NhaA
MSLFLITLSLAGMDFAGRLAKLSIIVSSTVAALLGMGIMSTFPVDGQYAEEEPADPTPPLTPAIA